MLKCEISICLAILNWTGLLVIVVLERVDIAECKDRAQVALHRGRYDFTLARLTPGQRVLEVGTGPGTFTKELFPKCATYIGVEFDPATCEVAREKTEGKAEILQGDARNLPFANNQFSFVICLEVLEHLGDFAAGVRNIHRCITPDGTAVVSVPHCRRGAKSKINPYHIYEPGEAELVSLFRQHFSEVEVYYQYFEETWWMGLARRLHLRRLMGVHRMYADLAAGLPRATERVHIAREARGMKITLLLVARGKR